MVGDRGRVKSKGKDALNEAHFKYISALVSAEQTDASTVDERYRSLQQVARDFRQMKTGLPEVRPIFVRNTERTRGHVFVAKLALKIVRQFSDP